MSVYQRFFVELEPNTRKQVGQLIVSILGGDAWIKRSDDGEILKPVDIIERTNEYVIPARTEYGGVITNINSSGNWYWLDSIIDYGSQEALNVAKGLTTCPYVQCVAEDNDSVENEDDPAWIIG